MVLALCLPVVGCLFGDWLFIVGLGWASFGVWCCGGCSFLGRYSGYFSVVWLGCLDCCLRMGFKLVWVVCFWLVFFRLAFLWVVVLVFGLVLCVWVVL